MSNSFARIVLRCSVVGTAAALVGSGGVAFADAPSNWEDSPAVSGFDFLLVLFLIPLSIGLVITTLTILPSLVKGTDGSIEVAKPQPDHDVTPTR